MSQNRDKPMIKRIKREIEDVDQDDNQYGQSSSTNPPKEIKKEIDDQYGEGNSSQIPAKKIKMEVFDEAQLLGVPTIDPATGHWDLQVPFHHLVSSSQSLGTLAASKVIKIEEPDDIGDQVQYLHTCQNPGVEDPILFKSEPIDPEYQWVDATDQKPTDLHALDKKIERTKKIVKVFGEGSAKDLFERLQNVGIDPETLSPEEVANPEALRAGFGKMHGGNLEPPILLQGIFAIIPNRPPAIQRFEPQHPVFNIREDTTADEGKNSVIKLLFEKVGQKNVVPLIRLYQLCHYEAKKEVPSLISCLRGKLEMADDDASKMAYGAMAIFSFHAIGEDERVVHWAQLLETKCGILGITAFDYHGEPLVPIGDYPAFEPAKACRI